MTKRNVSRIPIIISLDGIGKAGGELIRHLAPRTVDAISRKLPLEGRAVIWNDEVYFEIPIHIGNEKSKVSVEKGTLAFWPMGSAFCIFFGETQPYSPVNIIGRITKNIDFFSEVKKGSIIKVNKV
jgi:hypothetical protein